MEDSVLPATRGNVSGQWLVIFRFKDSEGRRAGICS